MPMQRRIDLPRHRVDVQRFLEEIFDRFPLPDSPGYHAFRHWYGWEPVPVQKRLGTPPWKVADLHEGRADGCEEMV